MPRYSYAPSPFPPPHQTACEWYLLVRILVRISSGTLRVKMGPRSAPQGPHSAPRGIQSAMGRAYDHFKGKI